MAPAGTTVLLVLLPGGWVRPGVERAEQKAEASTAVFLRHATCPAAGASDGHELRGSLRGTEASRVMPQGRHKRHRGQSGGIDSPMPWREVMAPTCAAMN